jgi:hypothetical protein
MHLNDLPKERVPKAPRTWKELSLQFDLLLFNASIIFFNAVSFCFACVT